MTIQTILCSSKLVFPFFKNYFQKTVGKLIFQKLQKHYFVSVFETQFLEKEENNIKDRLNFLK